MTIRQRIDEALDLLKRGLNPFVAQQMANVYRNAWVQRAKSSMRDGSFATDRQGQPIFDTTALCSILIDNWNDVFGVTLGRSEQKLVHRIRDVRNDHAHQREFSPERVIGALEDIETMLTAAGALAESELVRKAKEEVGRERYGVGATTVPAPPTLIEAPIQEKALVPWRDVVTPHADVRARTFVNADFAADLYQVWTGAAGAEYADAEQFFARTYLTSGLRSLIEGAARRITGLGGDPVIELQTSFGGGKTHALLSLFHLFGGTRANLLAGAHQLLAASGISALPSVNRAVLVGTRIGAGQPSTKRDGTIVRTLWGELAYQLGGPEGYAIVEGADKTATSPADKLDELLKRYSPCLILIDEWVAYARQLLDEPTLCGGTFETQFTFAQTLTEAVAATPGALLVVSLPVSEDQPDGSDREVGGVKGREALRRLRNVLARKQANWQPADASESYEIVRRRLFEAIPAEKEKVRDKVVEKLAAFYRAKAVGFPQFTTEATYKKKITDCYPIHPELFANLYTEWGSLEQFQRTRGVLRFMAAIIHVLWAAGDKNPLIMPGLLPLDDASVTGDLVAYLGDPWRALLLRDVFGDDSRATRIDERSANLGRYKATARVARAIFLATAPQNAEGGSETRNRGIDMKAIRLGCAFPEENLNAFDDATRRLADEATHLSSEGARYWFQLSPNLNRRAQDEAGAFQPHEVQAEIVRRLGRFQRERGDFVRVHVAPAGSVDVPEERGARLVVLGPTHTHVARRPATDAHRFAENCLAKVGEGDRRFKNTLIFLAPDATRMDGLERDVRQALAWKMISENRQQFELTPHQFDLARQKAHSADGDAERALNGCWCHVLVPSQAPEPGAPIVLDEYKVEGDSPPFAVAEKLKRDGLLNVTLGGANLRNDLDTKGLWSDATPHVAIARLFDAFTQYPYLRRLKNEETLRDGVRSGLTRLTWDTETFAYAESYDEDRRRYVGLIAGPEAASLTIDMQNGLLVRANAAVAQREAERIAAGIGSGSAANGGANAGAIGARPGSGSVGSGADSNARGPTAADRSLKLPEHFFLRVQVDDATRLSRVTTQLANDVIAHIAAIRGAKVEIGIEVKATVPDGINPQLEERLKKNASAHGFVEPEFES